VSARQVAFAGKFINSPNFHRSKRKKLRRLESEKRSVRMRETPPGF
jgi:hypothetical protein